MPDPVETNSKVGRQPGTQIESLIWTSEQVTLAGRDVDGGVNWVLFFNPLLSLILRYEVRVQVRKSLYAFRSSSL